MADEILSVRAAFQGWLNLLVLSLRLNGTQEERPLVEHPSGSAVLPYDPERRVALTVSETRLGPLYLGSPTLIEAVAGVAEDGDFAETAKREALEEAGICLRSVEKVGAVWMNPSTSTEQVHLFLAEYSPAQRVAEGGGLAEENECLRVRERPLRALWEALAGPEVADAKTLLLIQALRLRRPELFG
jgi:nudix-type nucleoside diphosphatase (YffH/AdpP family)